MYKQVLRSLGDDGAIFAVIAVVIFVIFFLVVLFLVFRMKGSRVDELANLPLDLQSSTEEETLT